MGIKRLSITWNAVRVFQALGLMAVGLLTPLIFTERNFRIYDLLYQAMNELDSGFLALGAIHLIALNTLRSGPDYLAITLLMDGISIQWNGREIPFVKIPFCCLFQISLYQVVYMVYSLRLDIGMPAILVFICIELLTRFSFRLHYKLIIITLFLITVQGLDVLPVMTKLGFGIHRRAVDLRLCRLSGKPQKAMGVFRARHAFVCFAVFRLRLYAARVAEAVREAVTTSLEKPL